MTAPDDLSRNLVRDDLSRGDRKGAVPALSHTGTPVLELKSVAKKFGTVTVLDDVSLQVHRGRTVSLVGESGSGKTTVARIMVGLEKADQGSVAFSGLPRPRRRRASLALHRRFGVVLQDPYESIDPRFTVGEVVAEPLRAQGMYDSVGPAGIASLLESVGMHGVSLDARPHRFSGGQRQRICIARALATDPELLICDEPTSALDISVQAQILNLLLRLQREKGLAYLFISHDIEVVRRISDEILVLHNGRIVERGTPEQITDSPKDPYTQRLLAAVPGGSPHSRRLSAPITEMAFESLEE